MMMIFVKESQTEKGPRVIPMMTVLLAEMIRIGFKKVPNKLVWIGSNSDLREVRRPPLTSAKERSIDSLGA